MDFSDPTGLIREESRMYGDACVGECAKAVSTPVGDSSDEDGEEESPLQSVVKVNNPNLNEAPPSLADLQAKGADYVFGEALNVIGKHYGGFWVNRLNSTSIVSQVRVRLPDGALQSRVIVFVSASGLPRAVVKQLTDIGVIVLKTAMPKPGRPKIERHAERSADAVRRLSAKNQTEMIGGRLESVDSAYVSGGICSMKCVKWLRSFIGKPDSTLKPGDNGMINNIDITESVKVEMRDGFGGERPTDNIYSAYRSGRFGYASGVGGGAGIGDGGVEDEIE